MAETTTGEVGGGVGGVRARSRGDERRWWAGLVGSLAIVLAVALIGGALTTPGMMPEAQFGGRSFYGWLVKPTWTPPGWLFGPVWATLYVLMAIAAWRVWRARTGRGAIAEWGRARRRGLALYGVQLVLNVAWSGLFFYARRPGWALVNILALDLAVTLTLVLFWRVRRVAGLLMVPYLAWLLFATALNAAIVVLNR
jgi:tryptophan-rich sensory protein